VVQQSKRGIKYKIKYRKLGMDTGMGICTTSIMKDRLTTIKGNGKDDEEPFTNLEELASTPMMMIDQCYRSGQLAPARRTPSHPGDNPRASDRSSLPPSTRARSLPHPRD